MRELFFTVVFVVTVAAKVSYRNHRVYNVIPQSDAHMELLKHLELNNGIEFWDVSVRKNFKNKVMISPSAIDVFEDSVKHASMPYAMKFEDVQK